MAAQLQATQLVTSPTEAMFSSAFVCLLAGLHKTPELIFTKFSRKVAHGPRKKLLDFGGLRYVRIRVMVRWG